MARKAIKLLLTDEQFKILPESSTDANRVMAALAEWAKAKKLAVSFEPLEHGGAREGTGPKPKKKAKKGEKS